MKFALFCLYVLLCLNIEFAHAGDNKLFNQVSVGYAVGNDSSSSLIVFAKYELGGGIFVRGGVSKDEFDFKRDSILYQGEIKDRVFGVGKYLEITPSITLSGSLNYSHYESDYHVTFTDPSDIICIDPPCNLGPFDFSGSGNSKYAKVDLNFEVLDDLYIGFSAAHEKLEERDRNSLSYFAKYFFSDYFGLGLNRWDENGSGRYSNSLTLFYTF